MSRGRAYTRYQRKKAWERTKNFLERAWSYTRDKSQPIEQDKGFLHVVYTNYKQRKTCSCYMCSPSRKFQGLPIQELRQPDIDSFDDDWLLQRWDRNYEYSRPDE